MSAVIVMPRTTPAIKVDAVRELGADVELIGDSYADAATQAATVAAESGRVTIHAFDDRARDRRPGHDRRRDPRPLQ